MAAQALTDEPE